MGNYLDNTYAAVDGVILSYIGEDVSLSIPKRLANMDVLCIGDGAFMQSEELQQVFIPSGTIRIGKRSFQECRNLMNVFIPGTVNSFEINSFFLCDKLVNLNIYDFSLNEREYLDLLSSSELVNRTNYLAHVFPTHKRINDAVLSTDSKPANFVQDGIHRLFTSQSMTEEKGAMSMTRNLDCFTFSGTSQYATEMDVFMELIRTREEPVTDKTTEEINDAFSKNEEYPKIEKTAVFSFDDSKTRFEDGLYYLAANIKIGYHFWPSAVSLIFGGKTYFIYRRHYLSSLPNLHYIRRDTAVFSERGLITDRREAQEVYAKYKLLSIL